MLTEQASTRSELIHSPEKIIWKLTALWGFSEAALGGLLHGLNIPFKGMFLSSAAIIFITLIAFYSEKKGSILRATIMVIIIKGMVSPHSPVTAYLAVFLQGLLGESFFFTKKMFRTSALLLAITVMMFTVSQKLIILTLLFGQTLWTSIDEFTSYIWTQFLFDHSPPANFSIIIVLVYAGIHLLAGFFIGITSGKLPQKINNAYTLESIPNIFEAEDKSSAEVLTYNDKRKKWWRKKSGIAFLVFSLAVVIMSYIFPDFGRNKISDVIIMLLRSIVIISLWYFIISPFILKMINKLIKHKQSVYSKEIFKMIELFPRFRLVVIHCWQDSSKQKSFKRFNLFLTQVLAMILLTDSSVND